MGSTLNVEAARLEAVACNLCGSDEAEEIYPSNLDGRSGRADRLRCTDRALGKHGRIVRCRACGLAYTNPREPVRAVLDAYEAVEDQTYLDEEQGRVETFRGSLNLLHKYRRPPGSLLDIGCYTGLFLSVAQAQGWTVAGVEPSGWACRVARERYHVEAAQGALSSLNGQGFDAATMWDVLEHFTDPFGELQRTHQILRPNGILALTTIDMRSPIARLLGRRWWWLMEMHLYYFTRETVAKLLERAGFEVLAIHNHVRMISLRYLCTRLEPWMGGLARRLSRSGEWAGVNAFRIPIVLGDIMTVVARRRP